MNAGESGKHRNLQAFFTLDRKKKVPVVSQFLVLAGKLREKFSLRPEKKDTVVCLLGARFWRLRPEKKKDTVVCLMGCAVVLFFVVVENFDYDWKKKKKQSSVGGKLAVFLLWREIFITTGKKKDPLRPEKKNTVVSGGGKLAFFL